MLLGVNALFSQDSLNNSKQKFGVEYYFNCGDLLGHSLGATTLIKNRHQFGLGGIVIPAVNPLKGKPAYGAYFSYDLHPFKTNKKLDLFFNSFIIYHNYSYTYKLYSQNNGLFEYNTKISTVKNFLGLGLNYKLTNHLNIKASVSGMIIGYDSEKVNWHDQVNNIDGSNSEEGFYNSDFRFINWKFRNYGYYFFRDDLLYKIGVNYYFHHK